MISAANKAAVIARCVERARGEFALAGASFRANFTQQDAAVLNILRSCEAAVDLAKDDLLVFAETIRTHLSDDSPANGPES